MDTATAEMSVLLREKADQTLDTWSKTKRVPDVDMDMHTNARG
ncbi:MAG: hypothetical protein ACR2QH_01685 [Geminicoccaceae bacterium]